MFGQSPAEKMVHSNMAKAPKWPLIALTNKKFGKRTVPPYSNQASSPQRLNLYYGNGFYEVLLSRQV